MERIVQIDEVYFRGILKYNRGRVLNGNISHPLEREMSEQMIDLLSSDTESNSSDGVIDLRCEEEQTARTSSDRGRGRTNNGNQVMGPWVLGLYKQKQNKRFIVVDERRASTLMPTSQSHVEPGSLIWTDEWASCRRLSNLGYTLQSVNHSENFIDPLTDAHKQEVERAWREEKNGWDALVARHDSGLESVRASPVCK